MGHFEGDNKLSLLRELLQFGEFIDLTTWEKGDQIFLRIPATVPVPPHLRAKFPHLKQLVPRLCDLRNRMLEGNQTPAAS